MREKRIIGAAVAAVSFAVLGILYSAHAVKSSDHQDTYNLATRSNTSADITDVFVFPSPTNPNNVVFALDTTPLIPAGMGTAKFFDPTLMWQFKISHVAGGPEDQVIQFGVSGTDASQKITMYGPAAPNEVGTTNTFVASTGSFNYNKTANLPGGIKVYAGPRADPFYFDLFAFFTFLGDRNFSTHSSQSDPGPGDTLYNGDNVGAPGQLAPGYDKSANPDTPSFNGFKSGTLSGTGGYACSTNPSQNVLADLAGGFNVLSFVVEVPRSMLTNGFSSSLIHVWATTNSSSGT
jgi:Domain of unknown function (DUF4331)